MAAIFWAVFSWPFVANAQMMCGERNTILTTLEKTYSETPVSMGLASNGAIIEILASPLGTFTIILTRPNGLSCVMAAGESWENLPKNIAPPLPNMSARNGIAYQEIPSPSTWHPGIRVGFRGYCRDLRDIFRLAQLYNADPTARTAFAYFHAPGNSCWRYNTPQVGILRERVSVNYVVNSHRNAAHIWLVDVGDDGYVYVIVAEKLNAALGEREA